MKSGIPCVYCATPASVTSSVRVVFRARVKVTVRGRVGPRVGASYRARGTPNPSPNHDHYEDVPWSFGTIPSKTLALGGLVLGQVRLHNRFRVSFRGSVRVRPRVMGAGSGFGFGSGLGFG